MRDSGGRMNTARELHLLTQVPTITTTPELDAFRSTIIESDGSLSSELARAIDLRASLLKRRGV